MIKKGGTERCVELARLIQSLFNSRKMRDIPRSFSTDYMLYHLDPPELKNSWGGKAHKERELFPISADLIKS